VLGIRKGKLSVAFGNYRGPFFLKLCDYNESGLHKNQYHNFIALLGRVAELAAAAAAASGRDSLLVGC